MNKYSEFLQQKLFLIEYEAIKHLNSSDIKELQEFIKDVIKIVAGSPSYIEKRRYNELNK